MAERPGAARAREFVMTGGLYTAETLHDWGVINRVLAADELLETARGFAARVASGPTQAHAATKRIVRAQADHGTRGADNRAAGLTAHLFDAQDTQSAVHTFWDTAPARRNSRDTDLRVTVTLLSPGQC